MRMRLILLAAAVFAAPLPALAQDPPTPAPATAAAPGEAEVTAAAQTFRSQLEAMNAEIRAAVEASGSNRRRAASRVDEILARYAPGFETFAIMLERHFAARAAAARTEEARVSTVATGVASAARIRGIPDQVRAGLTQQAPARPEQPRNTQPSTGY
ncbi:MAG: hypothetical protein M3Q74_05745 [Pseudomonadota bacterium]|nr:hypothetical protein [Pseudomonadota bacterium]